MKEKILNQISRLFMLFESKMNNKHKRLFTITGVIWGMLFFFIQGIPAQIYRYTSSTSTNGTNIASVGGDFSLSLIFGIGMFVFYTAIGATLFIVVGEIFIRFCEYFHINSRLYQSIVRIKDTTTMNSVDYFDKYGSEESIESGLKS